MAGSSAETSSAETTRHPRECPLTSRYDSEKQPQGHCGRSFRTMSPQPPGSSDSGKPGSPLRNRTPSAKLADFRARLDTRQVEGELDAIFRESPEFGRNLAHRLSPFLESHFLSRHGCPTGKRACRRGNGNDPSHRLHRRRPRTRPVAGASGSCSPP